MEYAYPVKVGVDGSQASLRAALWAADEAIARGTKLDLVYVIDTTRIDDLDEAMATARHAIHRAWSAVTDSGRHVELESEILQGNPAIELANAARHAVLVCVGHEGSNDSAPQPRGATAEALVRMAPTSVAIVRRKHSRPPTFHRWVVAVVDESAESRAVLRTALDEAKLREAPVLALTDWSTTTSATQSTDESDVRATLERCLRDTLDHTADVQVCALPVTHDITTILEQSAAIYQLVVLGASRTDVVELLSEQHARAALRHTNCSVLVVRVESEDDSPTTADEGMASVV